MQVKNNPVPRQSWGGWLDLIGPAQTVAGDGDVEVNTRWSLI